MAAPRLVRRSVATAGIKARYRNMYPSYSSSSSGGLEQRLMSVY